MEIESFYEFSRFILGDLPTQFQFLNAVFAFMLAFVFVFVVLSLFVYLYKWATNWW